nr:hypothetical protein [Bacteroidales bacterium]
IFSRALSSREISEYYKWAIGTPKRKYIFAVPQSFSSVFTQSISVSSSKTNILNRSLVQPLIVSSDKILKPVRNFIETININQIYEKILTSIRTFTEPIVVSQIYNKALTAIRNFVETIKTIEKGILKQTERLFAEIFTISESDFSIKRTFIKFFTETIDVISSLGSFIIGKLFIQPLQVISSILNQSTFFKVFSEIIKISDNIIKSIGKIFSEIVNAISSFNKTASRVLVQQIKIISNLINQITHTLIENVIIAMQFVKKFEINREFMEKIKVSFSTTFVRFLSRVEHLVVYGFMGSMKIAKTFIETIKGGANVLFRKIQFITLNDVLVITSNIFKKTSRVFKQTLFIVGSFTQKTAKTFIETITSASSFFGMKMYEFLETIKTNGIMTPNTIGKLLKEITNIKITFTEGRNIIFAEIMQISDNIANKVILILKETLQVGVSFIKLISKRVVQIAKIASPAIIFRKIQYKTLIDNIKISSKMLIARCIEAFTEVVLVSGIIGNWMINKLFVQPVLVIDKWSKKVALNKLFSETLTLIDNLYNQTGKIFEETIINVDNFIRDVIGKRFYELVSVYDKISKSLPKTFLEIVVSTGNVFRQTGKIFAENIKAVGQFILGTISKLFIGSIKIIEKYTKIWTLSRLFEETVNVVSNVVRKIGKNFVEVVKTLSEMGNFAIGKLLTEVASVRTKLKLVLNGIQVGLWRKVARITGTWRKWGRKE